MKLSGWGLTALALGTACGAAIVLASGAATLALAVVLFLGVGGFVFATAVGSSPRSRPPEVVDEQVALLEEPVESNDPIRRALFAGTVLTMLIVAADAQGYTLGRPSGLRYLLLGVPLFILLCGAAVTANKQRLARTTVADRFLLVYGLCGLLGSVFGRAFLHTPYSGTVIFLPMCLGLADLMVRDAMTGREAERFQRWLVTIGVVFLVFGIVSQTPLWPLVSPRQDVVRAHVLHRVGVGRGLVRAPARRGRARPRALGAAVPAVPGGHVVDRRRVRPHDRVRDRRDEGAASAGRCCSCSRSA